MCPLLAEHHTTLACFHSKLSKPKPCWLSPIYPQGPTCRPSPLEQSCGAAAVPPPWTDLSQGTKRPDPAQQLGPTWPCNIAARLPAVSSVGRQCFADTTTTSQPPSIKAAKKRHLFRSAPNPSHSHPQRSSSLRLAGAKAADGIKASSDIWHTYVYLSSHSDHCTRPGSSPALADPYHPNVPLHPQCYITHELIMS
jgi:hypothetical protein